jgi:ribosomal protein L7Ae-like RNA K-turn-binding protein
MRDKIDSYLGFAARSRNLVVGTDTCRILMGKGKLKLLILATDLSENTREKVVREAIKNNVPYKTYETKEKLSKLTGEKTSGVFGILDDNFKNVIVKELENKEGKR